MDIPEGAIPLDQFEAAPEHDATAGQHQGPVPAGAIPVDQFQSSEDAYGTPSQQLKAGLEGLGQGFAGPIATGLEKLAGVKPEDIRGRAEENPITHGVGEAAGLGVGMLTGTGEAAVMGKAGQLAVEAAGLADVAKTASLGFKVGSAAVQQAAEMAVLQGGDEVSKMMLNDPGASVQTAMVNIGLSAALGAGAGAFMEGAISPLWKATAGPKVEELLTGLKGHLNGTAAMLPEEINQAINTVGVEIPPELRAVMSGHPTAEGHFHILKEAQHTGMTKALTKLDEDLSNSVGMSLGVHPEEVAVYSENEAGQNLLNTFKKEYNAKYGPVAEAMEKRNAKAATISIPDEARLAAKGRLLEDGMTKVGTDSPIYKIYDHWGERLLAKDTVGGMDMLKTEIGGEIEKALRAGDSNSLNALRDVRRSIADFQESQITKQAISLGKDMAGVDLVALEKANKLRGLGPETIGLSDQMNREAKLALEQGAQEGKELGAKLLNERAEANRMYKGFAEMSQDLTDHLGVSRFTGAKGLMTKLEEKVSAEQLMNKFSFKGNSEFIPFLQKNFPEVFNQVRENELKRFIKPSVLMAKGEQPININKLNSIIEKGMAGQKEYVQSILSPEALAKIQAANKLTEAIPGHRSSGTAGWMTKVFQDMPRSALAGVAMMTGHNPVTGGIIGEMAQRLGRDAPDALRLAHLKFLGSNQPIKSEGFKAMVDFMHNAYKGESALVKSTAALLKGTAQILPTTMMPKDSDRTKLDKVVTKSMANPTALMQAASNGHLGHYLPNQQTAAAETSMRAMQYLQSIKPQPHIIGPLDRPVPPQPAEIARYNRALDIAQQPLVVLQHIKDGNLMASDIADLHNMYPQLYAVMAQRMNNAMTSRHSDDEPIPYKTRMGMSLFLGAPVDKTLEPASIMAAQPKPPAPVSQQQAKGGGKSMKSLGKTNKSYQTATQDAESDRVNRD